MATKKTWTEKLSTTKQAQRKRIDFDFAGIPSGSNMFIATPGLVNEYIRQIPKGRAVSLSVLRNDLAMQNNADHTCPVTTGIFLRIASEAAWEAHQSGKPLASITPFWRVVEPSSVLAGKLACGREFVARQRKKEGIVEGELSRSGL